MTTLKIFAVLLIVVITLFETSVAQFGIPPIGAGMGGYGPVGGYGAQGGYGMGRGNYEGRGEYGMPGRGYGQGGLYLYFLFVWNIIGILKSDIESLN
ncbi:hypothetical protein TSAR_005185 [Trichomalopsis sarcophagae]|uniref:Uncharacterized protein n=1 Tax=Trichomalopsis sarcophagae TaxID=543379 RepID=A0A232EJT8_9HYME|nr:hypothetical protein TSAR_005185 [Trichomalopsis sarcophagae]